MITKINTNKLKQQTAFSIAEALIALLIGSLILGMSAPLITKQIKNQTLTDTQLQILQRQIDALRTNQAGIPAGTVVFYDGTSCPEGWDLLTRTYPNARGAFIRNVGDATSIGDFQQNAAPNITGKMENFLGGSSSQNYHNLTLSGAFSNEYLPNTDVFNSYYSGGYLDIMTINFDASEGGTTPYGRDNTTEVRPDNITLLACRKMEN